MLGYDVDVAVLLVFFNRPEVLKYTFNQIKKARPSKLLLYQDGPRPNVTSDIQKMMECRAIVESIDWNCQVYKFYQTRNFGCDPSGFIAEKWAFSLVDKCIIIEDDIVAETTFFRFCKEMLDKYENDERISRICGMNHLGKYRERKGDYFYSGSGSVWGWATWKRVMDSVDSSYSFLDNPEQLKTIKHNCPLFGLNYNEFIRTCEYHRASGKEHFESIHCSYRLINGCLSIIPSKNQISNIGLTEDSTHATSNVSIIPRGLRRVFFMKSYPLSFPIIDPALVKNDVIYANRVKRIMGKTFFVRVFRRIESFIRIKIYKG